MTAPYTQSGVGSRGSPVLQGLGMGWGGVTLSVGAGALSQNELQGGEVGYQREEGGRGEGGGTLCGERGSEVCWDEGYSGREGCERRTCSGRERALRGGGGEIEDLEAVRAELERMLVLQASELEVERRLTRELRSVSICTSAPLTPSLLMIST
jgi:hypothetical protein